MDNIKRGAGVRTSHQDCWERLMRLSDTQLKFADPWADVRGYSVFGPNRREIGYVRALIVDEMTPRVHFLEVAFGGVLGLGETAFLIPVELVQEVIDEAVFVSSTREEISAGPRYEPELRDLSTDDVVLILDYYGCPPYGQF